MEARIPAAHPAGEILISAVTNSLLLAIVLLVSCIQPASAQDRVLVPWQTITGGRLVARLDGNSLPGEPQGFTGLVFPSALAARGPDIYIADSGARKVYRFDKDQQVLNVVPGIDATVNTRLQIGLDQTLFVLGSGGYTVQHWSRTGQLLEVVSDPLAAASLEDFVVEEFSGQLAASDRRGRRLVAIDSMGWAKRPLFVAGGGEPMLPGALASKGRNIYAADRGCSCIAVIDETGQVLERLGEGTLVQPYALAADDHGRLFVADAVERKLWVYLHGERVASYEARKLHVNEISALAVDEGVLYIADGPGGQVVSFHIRPPTERRR